MKSKTSFTAGRITKLQCQVGKQQTFYWDAKTPCLGVRVTATGKKTYIFEGRVVGRFSPRRVTIGDVRSWTLDAAQNEAMRLKIEADQGIDPVEQAQKQKDQTNAKIAQRKGQALLVGDVWNEYIHYQKEKMTRAHIEKGKRWGERHLRDHENLSQIGGKKIKRGAGKTKQGVLYPLLQMRMVDITTEVLLAWQKHEAAMRANNARQGFEMFRAFWRWCAQRPEYIAYISMSAVESKELRDEVPSRKNRRLDVLDRAQLKAWFMAVRNLDNPAASVYLQALILTGARRAEMAGLRWVDIDFQWNTLWIKDKIAEEGRKIPLTSYLKSLIVNLPRRNEWVFSSLSAKEGKIVEPSAPHKRALGIAQLPLVTIHGLRRTFASLAELVEMPVGVVAEIMGHKPSATAEKHYKSRPIELLGIWHGKYETWILEQAGIMIKPPEGGLKAIDDGLPMMTA